MTGLWNLMMPFTVMGSFVLAIWIGHRSGLSNAADHAIAIMDGDSLENHKEWLNALIDARARKEKRK